MEFGWALVGGLRGCVFHCAIGSLCGGLENLELRVKRDPVALPMAEMCLLYTYLPLLDCFRTDE